MWADHHSPSIANSIANQAVRIENNPRDWIWKCKSRCSAAAKGMEAINRCRWFENVRTHCCDTEMYATTTEEESCLVYLKKVVQVVTTPSWFRGHSFVNHLSKHRAVRRLQPCFTVTFLTMLGSASLRSSSRLGGISSASSPLLRFRYFQCRWVSRHGYLSPRSSSVGPCIHMVFSFVQPAGNFNALSKDEFLYFYMSLLWLSDFPPAFRTQIELKSGYP